MATLIACALLASHVAHAGTYTWTNTTVGTFNLSSVTNWDASGVPPSDGTADVVFSNSPSATAYAYTVTVDTNWSAAGAVHSLTFLSGGNDNDNDTLSPGAGVTNLTIGAGGVKLDTTQHWSTRVFNINLNLSASQPWYIQMINTASENRYLQILKDVASPPGVNWILGGLGKTQFEAGSSTGFLGQVTLNGYVNLYATNQYGRLGANPITVDNGNNLVLTGSVGYPRLVFNDLSAGARTMPNAFVLNLTNTVYPGIIKFGQGPSPFVGTGASMDFTNSWSGVITNNMFGVSSGYPVWDDRYLFKFSGNNAALQGRTNSSYNAALSVDRVSVVLNGPHACGTNNSLNITVGPGNNAIIGAPSGLLATDGNTVNAYISVPGANAGMPQNNNPQGVAVLGLYGTGAVTFAGSIINDASQSIGGPSYAHVLRLTAPSNGTARFTGNLSNGTAGKNGAPIQILGLGDVALYGTNTGFKAQTLIRGGRLLLGSSAAVATNYPINLGDTVTLPAGGPVRLATVLPPANATNWTAGTYWFSAAPTIDGVVPAVGNRVLVKDEQSTPERHGIYTVNTATSWSRATDLDETNEFVYGLRILITNGTVNAGRAVYLFNRNEYSVNAFTVNVHKVAFSFEAAQNPDVALLTVAAITVSNNIVVANNYSTGASTLGGSTADASTFKGTITLNRDAQVTAAAGGSVTFSGALAGVGGIVKVGPGPVYLTGAVSNTGPTAVQAGTLTVPGGTTLTNTLTVAAWAGGSGTLAVNGDLTLGAGASLAVAAGALVRGQTYTLVTWTGARTGTFAPVTGLPYGWHVGYRSGSVVLYYAAPGTLFEVN